MAQRHIIINNMNTLMSYVLSLLVFMLASILITKVLSDLFKVKKKGVKQFISFCVTFALMWLCIVCNFGMFGAFKQIDGTFWVKVSNVVVQTILIAFACNGLYDVPLVAKLLDIIKSAINWIISLFKSKTT